MIATVMVMMVIEVTKVRLSGSDDGGEMVEAIVM